MSPVPGVFASLRRFLSEAVRSRLAWLVVSLHAAWFLLAIANMSPPSREVANFIEQFSGSTVSILAGRPFHFAHESLFLQLLTLFDLPSMFASIPIALLLFPLLKLLHVGLYEGSYVGAGIQIAMGSLQWLLVGRLAEVWLGSRRWGVSALQQINQHFVTLMILILLLTAVSVPLLNARSRRLAFRHAAISLQ
jgi:hypothetical protein